MNTYQGEGISRKNLFQLNVITITSLIYFVSFLFNSNFTSPICATFSAQIYFGRSFFFTLFQSNYFSRIVSFSELQFLQNNCFFLLFQNSYFFAGAIFLEKLFLRSKTSTEQSLLENRKFFTAFTFLNSYIFHRNCLG